MTLPALPSPSSITPAQVDDYASQVELFADECDDINEVNDTVNKWAAITEYIKRTSTDGVRRAETAMRHLEQRVGMLITAKREAGELATVGGDPSTNVEPSTLVDIGIDRHDASEFVAMAEYPEIVEQVIAESTDAAPPTRNKVRTAIRQQKPPVQRRPSISGDIVQIGAALQRATERIQKIETDDRFNRSLTPQFVAQMALAVDVCTQIINTHGGKP